MPYLGYTYAEKLFIIYLPLRFNWVAWNLVVNPHGKCLAWCLAWSGHSSSPIKDIPRNRANGCPNPTALSRWGREARTFSAPTHEHSFDNVLTRVHQALLSLMVQSYSARAEEKQKAGSCCQPPSRLPRLTR